MAHNLSEVDTFTAAVSVPDDGVDFRTAASLYAALQALTNRTNNLNRVLFGNSTPVTSLRFKVSLVVEHDIVADGDIEALGALIAGGGAQVTGGTQTDTLDVSSTSNFTGIVNANGVNAGVLTCTNLYALGSINQVGTTAADVQTIWATCTHKGPVIMQSTLDAQAAEFHGDVQIDKKLRAYAQGRYLRRSTIGVQSGGQNISVTQSTHWWYPTVVADQDVFIDDTGAEDGDEMVIDNGDSTHYVNVKNTVASGGALMLAIRNNAAGGAPSARVRRIAGLWVLMPFWNKP